MLTERSPDRHPILIGGASARSRLGNLLRSDVPSITLENEVLFRGPVVFENPIGPPFAVASSPDVVIGLNADLLGGRMAQGFWQTGGNAGTSAGTDFIGTTDNQPLEFMVNGQRALRLENNGDSLRFSDGVPDGAPNVLAGSPANFLAAGVVGATIAGGGATNYAGFARINAVSTDGGTVGGGLGNQLGTRSLAATISGGRENRIDTGSGPGVNLNAADRPLITRGHDPFTSGNFQGAGRWGLFMEPHTLVAGIPAIAGKAFRVSAYDADSTINKHLLTVDQAGTVTATTFNPTSDRHAKENFRRIDPTEVLEKVAALPISRWTFKQDPGAEHVGPMAQDFHAAFGLGTDDKHIATVDADGVALAAIQGLNLKLAQKETEITELKRRLEKLERVIQDKLGGGAF